MTLITFDRSMLTSTPWKNGGGRTQEIARLPIGSAIDDFIWRASIAEVSSSGPFSRFPEIDRILVLLNGDGVGLSSHDGRTDHRLTTPLVPFAFSGDDQIDASLLGGVSTDFNVMTRRGAVRAEVQILRNRAELAECAAGVLFVVGGTWTCDARLSRNSEATTSLPNTITQASGIWWNEQPIAWHLVPDRDSAALTAVRIWEDV
ncbi:MAG: HutD family protein [Gemmatimonadaceae bacterium]